MIKNTLRLTFEKPFYQRLFVVSTLASIALYYFTLELVSSWEVFRLSNPDYIVYSEIILSLANSVLMGLAVTLFVFVFRSRISGGGAGGFQTITSLFFSFSTTGCYVCGSVLLPTLGLGASIAQAPASGPVIKFLTMLLLLYSVRGYARNIAGICDPEDNNKVYKFVFSPNQTIRIRKPFLNQASQVGVTLGFVGLIFVLPSLMISTGIVAENDQYVCVLEEHN